MMRLIQRAQKDDGGFSLVELLISMTIFSVLMGMVFTVLITTQKQVAGAGVRLDDIDQGRMALDVLSRTLRTAVEPAQLQVFCTTCGGSGTAAGATAITDAQQLTITLYSNTDSAAGPNLITFSVQYDSSLKMTTLTKSTQPPDVGSAPNYIYTTCTPGPGCSKRVMTLVKGVTFPVGAPSFFQYFDNKGSDITPVSAGTSLTLSQLITIDSVGINMTVDTPDNFKAGPTTIYSRVGLPNSGTGVLVLPTATS